MDNSNLLLVNTCGVQLFCYCDEAFARSLPVFSGDQNSLLSALKLDSLPIKQGSHSHVGFFSSLIDQLASGCSAWKFVDVGGYIGVIGLSVAHWALSRGRIV